MISFLFWAFLGQTLEGRAAHPLAPSLPTLTAQEEKNFEHIIERYIQFKIGKLEGAEGVRAYQEFKNLPSAAFFQLVDAFNRTGQRDLHCPHVVIGQRIRNILQGSQDLELLNFARENLGVGVRSARCQAMVKELQSALVFRRAQVQQMNLARKTPTLKNPPTAIVSRDWESLARKETGSALSRLLGEIANRPNALDLFAMVASRADTEAQAMGRQHLVEHLKRQSPALLKGYLTHRQAEVRWAGVEAVRARKLPWGIELIDRLADADPDVKQSARQALIALSGGRDFGVQQPAWRTWWQAQAGEPVK